MRNIRKQGKIGKSIMSNKKDLTVGEMRQFREMYIESIKNHKNPMDCLYDAVLLAFYMGYAAGKK